MRIIPYRFFGAGKHSLVPLKVHLPFSYSRAYKAFWPCANSSLPAVTTVSLQSGPVSTKTPFSQKRWKRWPCSGVSLAGRRQSGVIDKVIASEAQCDRR
jgi:hypothetical protein